MFGRLATRMLCSSPCLGSVGEQIPGLRHWKRIPQLGSVWVVMTTISGVQGLGPTAHCAVNCPQHVRSSDSGTMREWCNTSPPLPPPLPPTRGAKGQLKHWVRQSSNRIYFYFTEGLKPLSDRGGEKTGASGETPDGKFKKKLD